MAYSWVVYLRMGSKSTNHFPLSPPWSSLCPPRCWPASSSCWISIWCDAGRSPTGRMSSASHIPGTTKPDSTGPCHTRTSTAHLSTAPASDCRDVVAATQLLEYRKLSSAQASSGGACGLWRAGGAGCDASSAREQRKPPGPNKKGSSTPKGAMARLTIKGCDAKARPRGEGKSPHKAETL